MAFSRLSKLLQDVRRSAIASGTVPITDGQLLAMFVENGDEAAFEAIVRRYGPMVLGVGRRLLRHAQDAEDVFQATFLVLVRKAGTLRRREGVGNWLYGVAVRTALQARARMARRRLKEAEVPPMPAENSSAELASQHELHERLDQELSRLPDKFREAIVHCDLMGKTMRQAAMELGCPEGTVSSRLTRGRELLKKRLTDCGAALPGTTSAVVVPHVVPPALTSATVKTALLFGKGSITAAGGLSPNVAALVNGVLKTMLLTKMKLLAGLIIAVSLTGAVASVVAWGPGHGDAPAAKARPAEGAGTIQVNPAKAEAAASPIQKKDRLLYGGKDFNAWRETLLTDLKPEVRIEAIKALGAFGVNGYAEEATTAILDVMKKYHGAYDGDDYKVIHAGKDTLARLGPTAIVACAKELRSDDVTNRHLAVDTLGNMVGVFPKETFPHLFAALKDQDNTVRIVATRSIIKLNSPNHQDFFASLTGTERKGIALALAEAVAFSDNYAVAFSDNYQEEAAKAIAGLGPEAIFAVPALSNLLKDKSRQLRNQAYKTILSLGPAAIEATMPTLIAILTEEADTGIRSEAFAAVGLMGPSAKDAVPVLIRIVVQHPDDDLGQVAVRTLGKIGPNAKEAVPALIAYFKASDNSAKAKGQPPKGKGAGGFGGANPGGTGVNAAIIALGKLGPAAKDAVPLLIAELKTRPPGVAPDSPLRSPGIILTALGEIGPAAKEAVPILIGFLKASYPKQLRAAVIEALDKINR